MDLKRALGYTEAEARRELATLAPRCGCSAGVWPVHNPQRTEVTCTYVLRHH